MIRTLLFILFAAVIIVGIVIIAIANKNATDKRKETESESIRRKFRNKIGSIVSIVG